MAIGLQAEIPGTSAIVPGFDKIVQENVEDTEKDGSGIKMVSNSLALSYS